jgi:transcriptional regulator with XRE-family HTH domain
MAAANDDDFIAWLEKELNDRNWSDNQLAKRAGISHSVISKARSGLRPKWDACEAIAGALQLPVELVFRKAGLLAPRPDDDVNLEEWNYLLSRLPQPEREELLQIARLKLKRQISGQQNGRDGQTSG